MRIKVHDGTASDMGRSLCNTCRHATITRGHRLDEEIVRCEAQPMVSMTIRFKVSECTGYIDSRLPTYAQLLEQAWILKSPKGRRAAGFVRSTDLGDEEFQDVLMELRDAE